MTARLLDPVINAIKRYGLPFLLLQACGVTAVSLYYYAPAFQDFYAQIREWKVQGGWLFAAWTTALAGGILPEIAKSLTGKADEPLRSPKRLKSIFFNSIVFAGLGVAVNFWYWFQALVFGDNAQPATVAIKVAMGQLIFGPFIVNTIIVVIYLWHRNRFNIRATLRQLTPGYLWDRLTILLIPGWLYWVPMDACAYSMPQDLQFPLFLFSQAGWNLFFIFIAKGEDKNIPKTTIP